MSSRYLYDSQPSSGYRLDSIRSSKAKTDVTTCWHCQIEISVVEYCICLISKYMYWLLRKVINIYVDKDCILCFYIQYAMRDIKTFDLKKIVNKGYISCFHPQYAMCDTKTYDLKVTRFICVFDILFEYWFIIDVIRDV